MIRKPRRAATDDAIRRTWRPEELGLLAKLATPEEIQAFLDEMPYATDVTFRSPRQVMRDRRANCMEGAVFAAAARERLGDPPVIVNLKAVRDDDHVIAVFRRRGRLGAIAKSNYAGLRWRTPIYRTLRELAASYFDHYYNPAGELTLRAYTRPLDLRIRKFADWRTRASNLDDMADHLDALPSVRLLPAGDDGWLRPVDARLYRAGLLGADERGLYHG